jgi:hypothetical protein
VRLVPPLIAPYLKTRVPTSRAPLPDFSRLRAHGAGWAVAWRGHGGGEEVEEEEERTRGSSKKEPCIRDKRGKKGADVATIG